MGGALPSCLLDCPCGLLWTLPSWGKERKLRKIVEENKTGTRASYSCPFFLSRLVCRGFFVGSFVAASLVGNLFLGRMWRFEFSTLLPVCKLSVAVVVRLFFSLPGAAAR